MTGRSYSKLALALALAAMPSRRMREMPIPESEIFSANAYVSLPRKTHPENPGRHKQKRKKRK